MNAQRIREVGMKLVMTGILIGFLWMAFRWATEPDIGGRLQSVTDDIRATTADIESLSTRIESITADVESMTADVESMTAVIQNMRRDMEEQLERNSEPAVSPAEGNSQ